MVEKVDIVEKESEVTENKVEEEIIIESEPTKESANAVDDTKDTSEENTEEDPSTVEDYVEDDGSDERGEAEKNISEIVKKIEGKCASVKVNYIKQQKVLNFYEYLNS